ncbi:MAG: hypothetical protein ACRDNF_17480 [Streptosporangiaceae bacterium]
MTQRPDETEAVAQTRAQNLLAREIRDRLKGQGLDIRERDKHLVITCPRHPDKGKSIHIVLASGEVSLKRTSWDYLGHLPGHGSGDPDEPGVNMDTIIAMLTRLDAGPEGEGDSQ